MEDAPKEAARKTSAGSGSRKTARLAEDYMAFMAEYSSESDRAAVILIGARCDYLLRELLGQFFVPNTGSSDELLDSDRPLGTFSSRIHVVYRLGLIDAEFARALHLFRRLRNTFAHETAKSTFDSGPSRDRIRELVNPLIGFSGFATIREAFFKGTSPAAADFYSAAAILLARLEYASHNAKRLSNSNAVTLIAAAWTPEEKE